MILLAGGIRNVYKYPEFPRQGEFDKMNDNNIDHHNPGVKNMYLLESIHSDSAFLQEYSDEDLDVLIENNFEAYRSKMFEAHMRDSKLYISESAVRDQCNQLGLLLNAAESHLEAARILSSYGQDDITRYLDEVKSIQDFRQRKLTIENRFKDGIGLQFRSTDVYGVEPMFLVAGVGEHTNPESHGGAMGELGVPYGSDCNLGVYFAGSPDSLSNPLPVSNDNVPQPYIKLVSSR